MIKTITIGLFTLAISFFVGTTYINAQTATTSPTSTPTPTVANDTTDDTPSAAPQTGFGNK